MNFGNALTLIRNSFNGVIDTLALTANRTYNLPDKSGTIALTSDITGGSSFSEVLNITASRTLILSDVGKFIVCNNTTDITITIPLDSSVPILVSSEIEIMQNNTGRVNIVAASGVTLSGDGRANQLFQILNRFGSVTIKQIGSNNWRIFGSLSW